MMKNAEVVDAFLNHREGRAGNLFTDGRTLWSYRYSYPIALWHGTNTLVVNRERYSATTSRHQSLLRNTLYGVFQRLPQRWDRYWAMNHMDCDVWRRL